MSFSELFSGKVPETFALEYLDSRRKVALVKAEGKTFVVKQSDPKRLALDKVLREHEEAALALHKNEFECQKMAAETRQAPKPYDFRSDNKHAYFNMPYVQGDQFSDALEYFNEAQVFRRLKELAEAIQKIHEKGIDHHDIKLENIIIPQCGKAKLVDFGCAKIRGKKYEGVLEHIYDQATTQYAAPEQLLRHGEVNGHTDAFQLAATIYVAMQAKINGQDPCDFELNIERMQRIGGRLRVVGYSFDGTGLNTFSRALRNRDLGRLERITIGAILSSRPENRPEIQEFIDVLADYEHQFRGKNGLFKH